MAEREQEQDRRSKEDQTGDDVECHRFTRREDMTGDDVEGHIKR